MINIDDIEKVRNIIVINDILHHQHRHHHANLCDKIFVSFRFLLVLFFVMRTFPFDRSIRTEELTITVEVMQWAPPRSSTFCTFLSLILFRLLCVFLRYCTRVLILLATGCYHSCSLFFIIIVHVVCCGGAIFSFFLLVVLHVCMYVCVICFCISLLTYTRVFN